MSKFIVQLAGTADYARGIIGPALSILLKWHYYDSRWLCASECNSEYSFDYSINEYVNGENKNASHLIIDVEKSKYARALHSKYRNCSHDGNTPITDGMTNTEERAEHESLRCPVSCTIYVEEKQLESTEANRDKGDENKSSDTVNNARCCSGHDAEMEQMLQEKRAACKADMQMQDVSNEQYNCSDDDDDTKSDNNSKGTLDKQSGEQETKQVSQTKSLTEWNNYNNNVHAKEVAKCNEANTIDDDDKMNNNQTMKTGAAEHVLRNPPPYEQSSALPSHLFVRVEVIYDKCNDADDTNKQNSANVSYTKKRSDNNATKSSETAIHHYIVIFNETTTTTINLKSSTKAWSAVIPHSPTFSRNPYKQQEQQEQPVHYTKGSWNVICNDIVDVVKSIWRELQKYESCNAVIDYNNYRNKWSRWSKNKQLEYEKWRANYYDQMIKRAVRLSQEYKNILSERYSASRRYSFPLYTCIAFNQTQWEKIKELIPSTLLHDKQIQSEFHMTTKFFGGSRHRVGCDDPLMFVLLQQFNLKEISVELEAIVSDHKGVAVVVRNLRENPFYDDYDDLYYVRPFNPKYNYNNAHIVSSETGITVSPESNKVSTEVECMTIAEQNAELQQNDCVDLKKDKITSTELSTHDSKSSCNYAIINNNTVCKSVDNDEITCIPFICGNATPHITIANAWGVKPVYSNELCHDWKRKLNGIQRRLNKYYSQQKKAQAAGADTRRRGPYGNNNKWNKPPCSQDGLTIKEVKLTVKGTYTFR